LPIGLAVRLTLDSTSYTNITPEWFEPLTIDYRRREVELRRRISQYLAGESPSPAFEISVPKKANGTQIWVVPSVNDQIICQAAVSSVSKSLQQACVDPAKVFSCQLNTDPNRLSFLEDQVAAWKRFRSTIEQQCSTVECMLQIDLKDAFNSINRTVFIEFLKHNTGDVIGVKLLEILLNSFSNGRAGLPFVNDSLFFLGNAFLQRVDQIIQQHTNKFVRFADDYKIFGSSRAELEGLLPDLRKKLNDIGFHVNDSKVKLGTGDEYLEAVAKLEYFEPERGDYIDTAVHPGIFDPKDMHALISTCLHDPDNYLHQGFGRLLLASLRRMRVRSLYSQAQGYPTTVRDNFAEILSEDVGLIRRMCDLFDEYSSGNTSVWRLVWLLYLSKDLSPSGIPDAALAKRFSSLVEEIKQASNLPPVCRLWATEMRDFPSSEAYEGKIENLHALDYVERGRRCYGA
jgi:Reverse transcriptase (RNA-dependent DNA polymerase)